MLPKSELLVCPTHQFRGLAEHLRIVSIARPRDREHHVGGSKAEGQI